MTPHPDSATMTMAEASAHLVATDPRFALTQAEIRGVRYPVFANAPHHVGQLLRLSPAAHRAGDFVVYGDERRDHQRFASETNRIAHALTEVLGVRPGDRVAIAMRNYPEFLMVLMALAATGAVVVLLNAWWTADEFDYALGDSGAGLVFADGPRLARLRPLAEARGIGLIGVRDGEAEAGLTLSGLMAQATRDAWPEVAIDPEDDFAIMYSSGSTGRPKGAVLTHRSTVSAIWTFVMAGEAKRLVTGAEAPLSAGVHMIVTPLFHVTALHPVWLFAVASGATSVLLHKWDADAAIDIIRRERVTRFVGVPTQAADLAEAVARRGVALPSLETLSAGGAKRPPAQVAEQARALPGTQISTGWGMTETNAAGLTLTGPEYEANPDAAGRLLPPLQEMRIVGPDGRALPEGEVGELLVKSACNMRGYLNAPEATEDMLRDGWLHTGDLARVDASGLVTIVDRKKSIIIRGGENVSCLEVEAALHCHPDVLEAGVFPVPDARLGETVGAAVTIRDGRHVTGDALRSFLDGRIAPFKIPAHFWVRATPLPRGGTDKIDRRRLAAECLAPGAERRRA